LAALRKSFADRIACSQDEKFIYAMRALYAGTANEGQQALILGWIINVACRVDETTFWPADAQATAFLEGRRSIAVDMVALMKAKPKEDKLR